MSDAEKTLLGVIELFDAKHLRSVMAEKGIELELVSNPETCKGGGCKVSVEVYASTTDLPQVAAYLNSERSRLLDDLNVKPEVHNEVFDTAAENATCPACGTQFSTKLPECPDCGLVFVPDGFEG